MNYLLKTHRFQSVDLMFLRDDTQKSIWIQGRKLLMSLMREGHDEQVIQAEKKKKKTRNSGEWI